MEDREINQRYSFITEELVDIPIPVKDAIESGVAMVWNKHVGEPVTFNVLHSSRITHSGKGGPLNWSSEYNPDTDTFTFAHDTIKERINLRLSEEDIAFLIAAHESTHKVQFHRGDLPAPSPKNIGENTPHYHNDRHEAEAWRESLDAFKKRHPRASGEITIGSKRYKIPTKTSY